mgnify:CR=1 FL=1
MTKRPERSMRQIESAAEAQLREAAERGDFDGLPGMGKPIPGIGEPYDELWWVKSMLKREGLQVHAGGLDLRCDVERGIERALAAPTEEGARAVLAALNRRIAEHNRTSTSGGGLGAIDVDAVLARRRS